MQVVESDWIERLLHLGTQVSDDLNVKYHQYADDISLEQAYSYCEQLTAKHSKSFFMASNLLKKEKRDAVRALYALCRTVDDIADLSPDTDKALQDLHAWRSFGTAENGGVDDLVSRAWLATRSKYRIPSVYVEQLLDTLIQDLHKNRYETFDEVAHYSYGVASTVGLMSMNIIGYRDEGAIYYAILLGVALQLTNILRDVHEDWQRGRIYLPLDELHGFGLDESDIEAARVTPAWKEFMRFQIDRTRKLYREALPGIEYLHPSGRLAVSAAAIFYADILNEIEKQDYDVFSQRASVSKWGKIRRLPGIWFGTAAV